MNAALLAAGLLKAAGAESARDWIHYTFAVPFPMASLATGVLIMLEVSAGAVGMVVPAAWPRRIALLFAGLVGGHLLVVLHPEWGRCPCLGPVDSGRGWSWGNSAILLWCLLGAVMNARAAEPRPDRPVGVLISERRRLS